MDKSVERHCMKHIERKKHYSMRKIKKNRGRGGDKWRQGNKSETFERKWDGKIGSARAVKWMVIDEAEGLRWALWPSNLSIDLSSLLGMQRWGWTGSPRPGSQLNRALSYRKTDEVHDLTSTCPKSQWNMSL